MELIVWARILVRWWWLIAIPTVIAAALALPALVSGTGTAGGFTTRIRYTAMQDMSAIPNRDGDFQDVWLASELAVNALTDWVTSSSYRDAIAAAAPTVDVAALGIAADNERSIGEIYLSLPDAGGLEAAASAAVGVLQTRTDAAFPQLGGAPAQVTILEKPTVTPAPPPLTNRFAPLLRVGLALLAGVGLALLAHWLDPFVRRRDDVHSAGLNVIGEIPR